MKITRKGYFTITGPDGELLQKPDGKTRQTTGKDESFEYITEDGRDGTFTIHSPDTEVEVPLFAKEIPETGQIVVNTKAGFDTALAALNTGDTILLADGTYTLDAGTTFAIPDAPTDIVIRSQSGIRENVIIQDGLRGFYMDNVIRATISDITIQGQTEHGVILNDGCDAPKFTNCVFRDIEDQFIKANPGVGPVGVDTGVVENCLFEYTTLAPNDYTNGVDVHYGDGWIVRDSTFKNFRTGTGLTGPAVLFWNGSRNCQILNCTGTDNCRDFALGLSATKTSTAPVSNGALTDHSGGLIQGCTATRQSGLTSMDVAIGIGDSPDSVVINNTVTMNGTYTNAIEYRFIRTTGTVISGNTVDAGIVARDGATLAGGGGGSPLFVVEDLTYLGSFRVPDGTGDSDSASAIGIIGYNPANDSMWLASGSLGHGTGESVSEVSIPALLTGPAVSDLNTGTELQPYEEFLTQISNPESRNKYTGFYQTGTQLIINAQQKYDTSGSSDSTMVIRDTTNIATTTIDSWFELSGAQECAGWISPIPSEWQASFGGATHLCGNGMNDSIVSRFSIGPSLWTFDMATLLADVQQSGAITATAYLNYPHIGGGLHYIHPGALTKSEGSSSPLWNYLSRVYYGLIVPNTDTYACFGNHGGVNSGVGYKIVDSEGNTTSGYAAYDVDDYYNYYWLYDVNEILAATNVYDPQPYAYGVLTIPFDDGTFYGKAGVHPMQGGTYDVANDILYLCLEKGDRESGSRRPLIAAYDLHPQPQLDEMNIFGVKKFLATNTAPSQANVFDVIAEVTFTHAVSASVITTEMYWLSTDQWGYSFMPDETGTWNYASVADGTGITTNDSQLDGITGAVEVLADATAYGSIVADGNKWARQKGDKTTLEHWIPHDRQWWNDRNTDNWTGATFISEYAQVITAEGWMGAVGEMDGLMIGLEVGSGGYVDNPPGANNPYGYNIANNDDPDPAYFDFAEQWLELALADGKFVGFSYSPDSNSTPENRAGWTNDPTGNIPHMRLIRYLAARLGAYPNWILSWGFDVAEYMSEIELDGWKTSINAHIQHPHMLAARDQSSSINYTYWDNCDFESKGQHFTFAESNYNYLKNVFINTAKPSGLFERYLTSRETEAEQRKIIHRHAVCGGLAARWGGGSPGTRDPYANEDWFTCYHLTWTIPRFDQMVDADTLIAGTGSVGGLRKSDNSLMMFYVEGSGSNQTLDLSLMTGSQTVKRIDCTLAYSEDTSHANVSAASGQTITLTGSSDWVIIIGE